jgi:Formate--tetrahydrofolate ligase
MTVAFAMVLSSLLRASRGKRGEHLYAAPCGRRRFSREIPPARCCFVRVESSERRHPARRRSKRCVPASCGREHNGPTSHVFNVRDVYLNAGAEFMVVLSGEIMTMPGLPKKPASDNIDIDADGNIVGLA